MKVGSEGDWAQNWRSWYRHSGWGDRRRWNGSAAAVAAVPSVAVEPREGEQHSCCCCGGSKWLWKGESSPAVAAEEEGG